MTTKLFELTGRIALIAGASRGIGAAIAKLLAEQGAHVIVTSRKLDSCQRVVDEIQAAGHSAEAMACHIGEIEQIEAAFAQVRATHGRLDILVNNAAANPYFGHVVDTEGVGGGVVDQDQGAGGADLGKGGLDLLDLADMTGHGLGAGRRRGFRPPRAGSCRACGW